MTNVGCQLMMLLYCLGYADFDIDTVRHYLTMSSMTPGSSHRFKSSISWTCWGCVFIRVLRLRRSRAGTEFFLVSLLFLEISFAVIMASNAKLSTKATVLKAPRPPNVPADSHLNLNTVDTSSNGRLHLRDSMSSRIIPVSFPLSRCNRHRKHKNLLDSLFLPTWGGRNSIYSGHVRLSLRINFCKVSFSFSHHQLIKLNKELLKSTGQSIKQSKACILPLFPSLSLTQDR